MRPGISSWWRFRSEDRDKRTDLERVAVVENAVNSAIRDAERERAGLQRRLDNVAFQMASLAGDGFDFLTREAEDTALLDEAEREYFRARGRERDIGALISKLEAVAQLLRSK
jgi:hypothetical protein